MCRRSTGVVRRRGRARGGVRQLIEAGQHLRGRGHGDIRARHGAVLGCRPVVADGTLEARRVGTLFLVVEVAFFTANLAKVAPTARGCRCRGAGVVGRDRWTGAKGARSSRATAPPGRAAGGVPGRAAKPRATGAASGGVAVHLSPDSQLTPLALRAQVDHLHGMREKVVIVSVESVGVPYVSDEDRFAARTAGRGPGRFATSPRALAPERSDVPAALGPGPTRPVERTSTSGAASYFVSRITILPTQAPGIGARRGSCSWPSPNAAPARCRGFGCPASATVQISSEVDL